MYSVDTAIKNMGFNGLSGRIGLHRDLVFTKTPSFRMTEKIECSSCIFIFNSFAFPPSPTGLDYFRLFFSLLRHGIALYRSLESTVSPLARPPFQNWTEVQ